jgi:hypothetical protein
MRHRPPTAPSTFPDLLDFFANQPLGGFDNDAPHLIFGHARQHAANRVLDGGVGRSGRRLRRGELRAHRRCGLTGLFPEQRGKRVDQRLFGRCRLIALLDRRRTGVPFPVGSLAGIWIGHYPLR